MKTLPQPIIDNFKQRGFTWKGNVLAEAYSDKAYGEEHFFTNTLLGVRVMCKWGKDEKETWCYGFGNGKYIWAGCDWPDWISCCKSLFKVLNGARIPGCGALDDPLRAGHFKSSVHPFDIWTVGYLFLGMDISQVPLGPDDFPEGFHFMRSRRIAFFAKHFPNITL